MHLEGGITRGGWRRQENKIHAQTDLSLKPNFRAIAPASRTPHSPLQPHQPQSLNSHLPPLRQQDYYLPSIFPPLPHSINMAEAPPNPLISTARASDTSPLIQLHPLVLLTISDYLTRHTLRQQNGPVAGAILGQQNGHEITMEVAFEAKLTQNEAGQAVLDDAWFHDRLEQCEYTYYSLSHFFPIQSPLFFTLQLSIHLDAQQR